jgi:lipoprotein-releasing system permease protein
MFEFSIAKKYLIPKKRQLSVSIIGLISILVISLVVWLILLFLSITDGMEKSWIQKLIALNAPVQVTPTEAYYQSYYYMSDTISADSDYRHKSLEEKRHAKYSDPYDPNIDPEPPSYWPAPDKNVSGELKDPVKELFQAIHTTPGLSATSFEMAYTQLKLRLLRDHLNNASFSSSPTQKIQSSFLALNSFTGTNPRLQKTLIPPNAEDLTNLLFLLSVSSQNIQEDTPNEDTSISQTRFQQQLLHILPYLNIEELKVDTEDWNLPLFILPELGTYHAKVCVIYLGNEQIWKIYLPKNKSQVIQLIKEAEKQGFKADEQELLVQNHKLFINSKKVAPSQLYLPKGEFLPCSLIEESILKALQSSELKFQISGSLQDIPYQGEIPYSTLNIGKASPKTNFSNFPTVSPLWVYSFNNTSFIPADAEVGEGILISHRFKENGVYLGDRGHLTYNTVTTSGIQEQRVPVYVAGFYDTGVMPIGNKLVLVNPDLTTLIRSSVEQQQEGDNGFNVWFEDFHQADYVKETLIRKLEEAGIERYWKIETYKEYDFSKTLVQQFQSDRNLLTLIAIVIILIACSNIISMLIILVNDKKKEIGILLSMGASSKSIALIFGLCGMVMGITGSLIGILAALLTLKNLDFLINIISKIQGYEVFHSSFYGETLPSEISINALILVFVATLFLSLIAGVIPALKASFLRPSEILRSE